MYFIVDGFSRPEYGAFKYQAAAEMYLAEISVVPKIPPLWPNYSVFTDGFAVTSPPFAVGSGLHILDPKGATVHHDWGP